MWQFAYAWFLCRVCANVCGWVGRFGGCDRKSERADRLVSLSYCYYQGHIHSLARIFYAGTRSSVHNVVTRAPMHALRAKACWQKRTAETAPSRRALAKSQSRVSQPTYVNIHLNHLAQPTSAHSSAAVRSAQCHSHNTHTRTLTNTHFAVFT